MSQDTKINIIFVDDEVHILDGLRRQFRNRRNDWNMRFAESGEAGLKLLEQSPADVVVSDMRMPGMSGVEFLRHVQIMCPQSVRIILSGQSDTRDLQHDLGAIHQFLDKPCDEARLSKAISRNSELSKRLDRSELRKVVAGIASLPVLPESHRKLLDALDDVRSDVNTVSRIVERDVGLTVKLLQMVNSAFFGLPHPVTRASHAIAMLGFKTVRFIALAGHVFDALVGPEDPEGQIQHLWDHSLELATSATVLARSNKVPNEVLEKARLSAMVSLIGRAVMIRTDPYRFGSAVWYSNDTGKRLDEAEQHVFGVEQQVIGAYLLGLWAFEDDVIDSVLHQADPEKCESISVNHALPYVHCARSHYQTTGLVETLEFKKEFIEKLGVTNVQPLTENMEAA